ncbi:MAG: hypothetical protein IVW54_16760 [Candidatus Binataceae bacterium]|nr:hypothetical protein [Candidatus Binataceae bacterium]
MTAPARPRYVEIVTTITGRTSDRYVITIKADGVMVDSFPALPWNVESVRNRQCAKWSNIAAEVYAPAIPKIFTLNYQTSWRNKYGR